MLRAAKRAWEGVYLKPGNKGQGFEEFSEPKGQEKGWMEAPRCTPEHRQLGHTVSAPQRWVNG